MDIKGYIGKNGRAVSRFEFYHVHMENLNEIQRLKEFIAACQKKLDNEKFINLAHPFVISSERKKLADAQLKLEAIERLNAGEEIKTVLINGVETPYLSAFTVEDSTYYITAVQKHKDTRRIITDY